MTTTHPQRLFMLAALEQDVTVLRSVYLLKLLLSNIKTIHTEHTPQPEYTTETIQTLAVLQTVNELSDNLSNRNTVIDELYALIAEFAAKPPAKPAG